MPPRAVSRTATSTSERASTCRAPSGPGQSPGSTRPLVDQHAVGGRRADVPAGRRRMWLIIRVVVVLPFVPLMLMIGIRRSASRIQAGGGGLRLLDPDRPSGARSRAWPPVQACRAGPARRSRSARRTAASAIARARPCPAPRVGHDPVARARTCDGRPSAAGGLRRGRPASRRDGAARRPAARSRGPGARSGTGAPRRTRAWVPGTRWPNQVRRRPTATSTFTVGSRR